MQNRFISKIFVFNSYISRVSLHILPEKKSLMVFLIHNIFEDEKEIASNLAHPQQSITINKFLIFIEYFLRRKYIFVSPTDIINGLDPGFNYILLTFDDGYYNNLRILEKVNSFKIPITMFISVKNIIENISFWWDIIYRERKQRNINDETISNEINYLKNYKISFISQYLENEFSHFAFKPKSDIDRPLTINELISLSNNPLITIGNHTYSHEILTNCNKEEKYNEINLCQIELQKITHKHPYIIAYPNGNYDEDTIEVSKQLGFSLGITTSHNKNYNFNKFNNNLLINRFTIPQDNLINKLDYFRSDIDIVKYFRSIIK